MNISGIQPAQIAPMQTTAAPVSQNKDGDQDNDATASKAAAATGSNSTRALDITA